MIIAECVRKVILEVDQDYIWAGHFGLCGEAYALSGGSVAHPLNRTKAVIDAVRRSPLFYQSGYIRASDTKGRREILHPVFKLKLNEADQ
jgi:hypothetical protein